MKSEPWQIPSTWVWVQSGEIAEIVGGSTPRTDDPANFEGGDIPWITPADLSGYHEKFIGRGERNITRRGLSNSGARLMPGGTVLFSSRAPIGYVAIASNPLSTNQGFKSFVLSPLIRSDYAYYYLSRARELAVELSSGTTFREISGAKAATIPFAVAPFDEQGRIVSEIEKQFTRLNVAVAALKRVQANLKRYRAAVLKAAVEGRLVLTEVELARREGRSYESASEMLKGIRAGLHVRREPKALDEATLPSLPDGWVWTSLGQLFSVNVGATPSRSKPEYWNGDIPWVSSGEIQFCRIRETREKITQLGLTNSSTSIHQPGTVLLGMIGEGKTRGQTAILEIAACNNQNSAAIRVFETPIPPEYVYRFLEGEYERTRRLSSGGNQPALNKERVRAIPIPLPPLAEIRRIVSAVEERISVIDQLGKQVEMNLQRAERLRQAILKRALEGRLVPQEPNDEPASILLERIRSEREDCKRTTARRTQPMARKSTKTTADCEAQS